MSTCFTLNKIGRLFFAVTCAAIALLPAAAVAQLQNLPPLDPPQTFRVLCYHDVRDDLRSTLSASPESTAIDSRELTRQFSWLKENGFQPVSVQQIVDARAGHGTLPAKAVLLSFDDGYESTYSKVFPLLQQFHYPAMIALVGSWLETSQAQNKNVPPGTRFLNWSQAREMQQSGLVEVASHSYALHQGIVANPQANMLPATTSRIYNVADHRYETDAAYATRIQTDLKANADLIERQLGRRPRAMVWPYGAYNQSVVDWSAAAGMSLTFNLDGGPNTPDQSLGRIRRDLVTLTTTVSTLNDVMRAPLPKFDLQTSAERVMQVDLDYVYDPNPKIQEANLSKLLERVVRMHPRTVYLQAFADPAGDGIAASVYFPNRHLPMRADLFSRVAWQLRTRAKVKVYAWMPVIAFRLPADDPAADKIVTLDPQAPASAQRDRSRRLSPFDPLVRKTVTEIYEDLGKHAAFAGVLFYDDLTLSDFEDNSPAALAVYRDEWQLPDSIHAIRANKLLRQRWAQHKSAYLNAFTIELANTLRRTQPDLMTARNIFAEPVLNPAAEEWYAQSLPDFLASYDYVALMAMPQMEKAGDPNVWMVRLLDQVKRQPDGLRKVIFKLQSQDWRTKKPIAAVAMAAQMRQLRLGGVRHLAYYPDDFHHDQPALQILRPAFSNAADPLAR